jgi:hypothetical protein
MFISDYYSSEADSLAEALSELYRLENKTFLFWTDLLSAFFPYKIKLFYSNFSWRISSESNLFKY